MQITSTVPRWISEEQNFSFNIILTPEQKTTTDQQGNETTSTEVIQHIQLRTFQHDNINVQFNGNLITVSGKYSKIFDLPKGQLTFVNRQTKEISYPNQFLDLPYDNSGDLTSFRPPAKLEKIINFTVAVDYTWSGSGNSGHSGHSGYNQNPDLQLSSTDKLYKNNNNKTNQLRVEKNFQVTVYGNRDTFANQFRQYLRDHKS